MTLRGTPFVYYGEEIGMKNSNIPRNKILDAMGKKFQPFFKGRDGARTPMQWNDKENAGFSKVEPWLPINKNYPKVNVELQNNLADSQLNMYRKLIQLRREYASLQEGNWRADSSGKKGILAYSRKTATEHLLIILNFTSSKKHYYREFSPEDKLIFSTKNETEKHLSAHFYTLQAFEGIIVHLSEI